jgi:hypothetical protein
MVPDGGRDVDVLLAVQDREHLAVVPEAAVEGVSGGVAHRRSGRFKATWRLAVSCKRGRSWQLIEDLFGLDGRAGDAASRALIRRTSSTARGSVVKPPAPERSARRRGLLAGG